MPVPAKPKIYHIVHADRLASIVRDGFLWSDAEMVQRQGAGTTIGMSKIKLRRLSELTLSCHPGLHGLELLATVHWVATREHATDPEGAATKVYAWNDRKHRFSPRQIGIAYKALRVNGWLTAA
jgi:hypothetical protein